MSKSKVARTGKRNTMPAPREAEPASETRIKAATAAVGESLGLCVACQAKRMAAAPGERSERVTFKRDDVREWSEWLDGDERQFMDVVEAAEYLASSANTWCDAWNKVRGRDIGPNARFDEIEEARNLLLKQLLALRQNHRFVRDRFVEAAYGCEVESVVRT